MTNEQKKLTLGAAATMLCGVMFAFTAWTGAHFIRSTYEEHKAFVDSDRLMNDRIARLETLNVEVLKRLDRIDSKLDVVLMAGAAREK